MGGRGLDRLWAGWRSSYIESAARDPGGLGPDDGGRTLFERILHSDRPDDETYVLWRGTWCFALLNAYPYGTGHLMVLPQRAVAHLEDLDEHEATELWVGVTAAVAAVKAAYRPDGVNLGANLGEGAGAGVPDHLHVHVLPRWVADSNFMTAVAETRVLPEPLDETWRKLCAAWPV
ncbi:MAG: HIT domain-containing protein [Acidimicrobiales bacterium]